MTEKIEERAQKKFIKELQKKRGSKVFCYITSDRKSLPPNIPGINTQLANDAHSFIYKQLRKAGKVKKIDLLLYTRGGMIDSVLPLVNLFRNYCEEFNVLVPYLAYSAGTLLCLGADNIIMSERGELSPIDPTTANQFNPRLVPNDPMSPQIGIGVEDVISFFELAKDGKVGIKKTSSEMLSVFQTLTSTVHPLALGNVYRIYQQIRFIAKKLLKSHLKGITEKALDEMAETFVKRFHSHSYPINHKEAAEILGKNFVKQATPEEEKIMFELFEEYARELQLYQCFNLNNYFNDRREDEREKPTEIIGAYFEDENSTHCFRTDLKITQRQVIPPNMQIQIQPGQEIPYIPGFPKKFEIEILHQDWKEL